MTTESAVKANPKARSLIEKLRVNFDIIDITLVQGRSFFKYRSIDSPRLIDNIIVDNDGDYQNKEAVTGRPSPCMVGWYAGFGTQHPIEEGRIYLKIVTDEGNECLVNEQDIKYVNVYKHQERVEF